MFEVKGPHANGGCIQTNIRFRRKHTMIIKLSILLIT
jgi:hypothetical protein